MSQPRARIHHRNPHAAGFGFPGADQQISRSLADAAHCLDGVDDEVQDHLLQLDAIAVNERQTVRELRPHRNAVLHRFAAGELNHFADRRVEVHAVLLGRRLPHEGTDAGDNVAGSLAGLNDTIERLPHLLEIRRPSLQPAQSGLGVGDRCGDRLFDFMSDRGCELAHGGDAVRVRQLHLHLAQRLFGPLALGQIEYETDALVPLFVERGRADQRRHAAAVLTEILPLVRLDRSGHL